MRPIIKMAITAGKMENNAQIMLLTESASVMVIMVCPVASVPETNPAMPKNNATNEPEMAVPNFCDMVPLLKMSPVDEVPFFSVA